MPSHLISTSLYEAVTTLARAIHSFSDADCGQPYAWRQHHEGVRLAVLGTYQELQTLAVQLSQSRPQPVTAVQQILQINHLGFRDLEALYLGTNDAQFDQTPAPGEWSLRTILQHIIGAERGFFTLVLTGLHHHRNGETPPPLPDDAVANTFEPYETFSQIAEASNMAELWDYYRRLHFRSWETFGEIEEKALDAPSPVWWEGETYPLQYRLRRFDAHLQQHLIQAEKTADSIGRPQTEARRLVRLLFKGLAQAEGALLGAPDTDLSPCDTLTAVIQERAAAVTAVVQQCRQLETAVKTGDLATIKSVLKTNPALADAQDQNSLPLVLTATYAHQPTAAQALVEAGAYLSIFSAAAAGNLERVKTLILDWSERLNLYGRDGFTPLQLACYFGHEDVALWLINQGADVRAVAQNNSQISAVHAAAACAAHTILEALLANGADINARQQNGYTVLHQAAHKNDRVMLELCLQYAADLTLTDDNGQTALDMARADGHKEAIARLEEVTNHG